ncbi:MAG: hypothetical protein QGH37_31055, partial [Candidatus Poribacteria bacterium]|nr:hypothetical protein [Candidatus Poribacteria bacterium]
FAAAHVHDEFAQAWLYGGRNSSCGYIKDHCPVAHSFKIGGMYTTDIILGTAPPERLKHLEQCHERHALVHPNDTILRSFPTL